MTGDPTRDAAIRLWDVIPAQTRAVLDDLGTKLSVGGPTLAAAILAWDCLAKLSKEERSKALAVLIGLASR